MRRHPGHCGGTDPVQPDTADVQTEYERDLVSVDENERILINYENRDTDCSMTRFADDLREIAIHAPDV